MREKKLFFLIFTLLIVGMACSILSGSNQTNTPPENQDTVSISPTQTATLSSPTNSPIPEGDEESGELPPLSFDRILQAGIDSADWGEGEGLVLMLKYFTGEDSMTQLPGISEVVERSGTGIIRQAWDYLSEPEADSETRAELERLLRILFPSQEVLDTISKPSSSISTFKLASPNPLPALQNQEVCLDLAGMGFDDEADAFATCYFYQDRVFGNSNFRVYYPYWWEDNEDGQAIVRTTFEALGDAANTYSNYQGLTVGDVNLILPILDDNNAYGMQNYFDLDTQACPMLMYPSAVQDLSTDEYKQVVAHEMFHCVQDYTFPNTKPYDDHKWWMEGTAEYFSNLVYPDVNLEWENLEHFDTFSASNPIFFMSYENFIFFQFMGNKYSTDGLINILFNVSAAGGPAGQAAALAATQDINENFNLFVVEYLSVGVLDSGGKRITTSPSAETSAKTISDKGPVDFTIQPFVAMRFRVNFKQEKRYLQNGPESDDSQFSSVEYQYLKDINAWSDLPPEVRSECKKDVRYLFAITTTKDSYVNHKVEVTLAEKAECDPCLLGTWDVDPNSFAEYMERIMARSGQTFDLAVSGHQYLQFKVKGVILSQREDFTITIDDQFSTIINGHGNGNYSADGKEMTVTNFLDITDSVGMDLGGGQITYFNDNSQGSFSIFGETYGAIGVGGVDLNTDNAPTNTTGKYVCNKDTLTVTIPEYGDLMFNRVDKILPTPIPTPGAPDNPNP